MYVSVYMKGGGQLFASLAVECYTFPRLSLKFCVAIEWEREVGSGSTYVVQYFVLWLRPLALTPHSLATSCRTIVSLV